jgi:hypothetical protein
MTPLATDVFIVRVWREPREIAGAPPEWRFLVEHVRSGSPRYFTRLDAAAAFIASQVPGLVAPTPWWRRALRR